jgi:hypothetical protein
MTIVLNHKIIHEIVRNNGGMFAKKVLGQFLAGAGPRTISVANQRQAEKFLEIAVFLVGLDFKWWHPFLAAPLTRFQQLLCHLLQLNGSGFLKCLPTE